MSRITMTVLDLQNGNRQLAEDEIPSRTYSAALGCFDGVHLGHRALLRRACQAAEETGAAPAVWTFSAPPFPARTKQLTTLSEKLALFAACGIRYVFLSEFGQIRMLSPADFVSRVLVGQAHITTAVCGFNFRFGHRASGDAALLSSLLSSHGRTLHITPAVRIGDAPVSATRIRTLLSDGDPLAAAACLGRFFSVTLPVVHGKQLGRTIGAPTINQNPPPALQLPANGTYATAVSIDGTVYPAVTNIGTRPSVTQDDHLPNAETHIIGYRGWLYDRRVTVAFRRRLRDERHFPSLDALKAQIVSDIAASEQSIAEDLTRFPL